MATGLDMLLKTFGLDADEMRNNVTQFRDLVLRLALAVERVEAQQRKLMAHFDIATEVDDNGEGRNDNKAGNGPIGNGAGASGTDVHA